MRTIVVGVDGSAASLRALRFAAGLAADLDRADIVVVYARFIYLALPEQVGEDLYRDVLDTAETSVRATAEAELGATGVQWWFESHDGPPADVLRDVAERTEASFIVVGRSGWSSVHEVLLGSVSNRLAHRPDPPLLLV